jgi:hypothetical protein
MARKLMDLRPMSKDEMNEMLVKSFDAPIATIFQNEDASSPLLREVAHRMRTEFLKLPEGTFTKPQPFLKNVDLFIEHMKKSGIPKEVRSNAQYMIQVLGPGFDTFIDVVELGTPIVRQVEYAWRHSQGMPDMQALFSHERFPCCWSVMPGITFTKNSQEMNRKMMELDVYKSKVHPVPHIQPLPVQHVEMHCDTLFCSVEAPKNKEGIRACGLPFIREGIIKQSAKQCAIFGITIPQYWLETFVGHPVEIELTDSPAVREGAVSCDIRVNLTPSLVRISSWPCIEPFKL